MKRIMSVAGSALALAASTFAQDIEIPFEKFETDNGLTVIVHEDRKAPVVAVSVWYKVGSKDEPEGQSGFAHLFEHLMFNGSENYDDEWFKPLQEIGATGLNGTTSFDRTNYFQTVPTPALDRILWMESDRMGHFIGAVTQDKLDEQRGVVQNEKRQGENAPYGRVFGSIIEGLFPPHHPYGHTVIGSMDDLNAATLDDVKGWFEEYYGPNNAILVLAGDIDADEAKPLVEKYFGDIEAGPPLTKWDAWIPNRTQINRETMYDQVPQARIYRVWVAPEDTNPVSTDLAVAASILGDGKNSRLYKEMVYDQQIATDVGVFNLEQKMASIFGVVVSVKEGESIEEVEKELDKQIAEFLSRPPKREEVELVATKSRAATIRGLEQVGGFGGKAVALAQGELVAGDPAFYQRELDELDAATPRGVQAAAQEWLKDNYYQLTVLPFDDFQNASNGVDRSSGLPAVTGETALDFPDVQRTTLSNGLNVVLAERSTIPVVNVALQFDAGYASDAGGKLGLASFTTRMLDEGAGKYDALGLAAELEKLGTTLGSGSNLDTTTVQMSALSENLSKSLGLMADVVLRPNFPEEEIERQRTQILTGIAQEKANPTSIALRMLPEMMYGKGHAYGIPLTGSGTEDVASSVTRDDLVGWTQTWMRPDNATLYVVGDTNLDAIKPELEKAFGKWRAEGEKPMKNIPTVDFAEPKVVIVNRPGSAQSIILAGHIAPPQGVENNIEISAMNEILGGNFNSRINTNLREDKAWSYGAQTVLVGAKAQRPWIILAPVQADKTAESIAEIQKELKGYLSEKPATDEELSRVVLDNIRSLPGQYETSGAVLGSLLSSGRYGRPDNYPETLPERYRALSTEDLQKAAADVIRPDEIIWLIIGDAEQIKSSVESAGIGDVSVMDMSDL
ncbi:MAG: insulinase family protein [Parvularculaceae bacterium]|nr:insulinase family protein [Parvularculaceae bacterium]